MLALHVVDLHLISDTPSDPPNLAKSNSLASVNKKNMLKEGNIKSVCTQHGLQYIKQKKGYLSYSVVPIVGE